MTKKYTYKGIIHIHTKFSDGTGNIQEISKIAKKAGADYIIITDHNNLDVEEGFINGVLVIKGEEITPAEKNHYLALGINKLINSDNGTQKYIDEVRAQGGFGFAAHPDESSSRKCSNPPLNWADKSIEPDGIEIWNWFSNWADNLNDKNIFTLACAYFFKHKLITAPKEETLIWWDKMNNKSKKLIPAIGGVDAHALKIRKCFIPVTIFPYKEVFNTIINVISLDEILSDDFFKAKEQILKAIKNGNNLIINKKINKNVPDIYIANSNNIIRGGEYIEFDNQTYLNISLKNIFDVKLLCNGKIIWSKKVKTAQIPILQKGIYRVEIWLKKQGYAFSNPMIVN